MVANIAGLKEYTTIHCGGKRLNAVLYVLIPELDFSAPLFLPDRIEIDKQIQPAVQLTLLDIIEIDMNIETSTGPGDVNAATDELLVSQKIANAGYIRQIGKKLW